MIEGLLLVLHVIVACLIVVLVLLQPGQGAHIGAGMSGAQSLFGSRGAGSFLTKLTTAVAIAFFATSLILAHLNAKAVRNGSRIEVIEKAPAPPVENPEPSSKTEVPM